MGVHQHGTETCISLVPSTMHERGCPRNFNEFYIKAKSLDGMGTKREAFAWYCRSRLHYSCSTVCVTFTEFVIPELHKRDIKTLHISAQLNGNGHVHLDKINVKGIHFSPEDGKVHCLRLTYFTGHETKAPVECGSHPLQCSHNALQCQDTGMVFDATIGQLSAIMPPSVFSSLDQYKAEFKGVITDIFDSNYKDIEGQKQRDIGEATRHRNPQVHPARIAERVVDKFLSSDGGKSTYCANCLGMASLGSKLLRCGKCKAVTYCSKTCQTMDWASHKGICNNHL